jgi:hypothetical protein
MDEKEEWCERLIKIYDATTDTSAKELNHLEDVLIGYDFCDIAKMMLALAMGE